MTMEKIYSIHKKKWMCNQFILSMKIMTSMSDDEHLIHKYYKPFLLSNNHGDVSSGS